MVNPDLEKLQSNRALHASATADFIFGRTDGEAAGKVRARRMISFADRAIVPSNVLVRFLDQESVLLNLNTERYFGLDSVGTRMWQLLTSAPAIDAAYVQLLEEFDVDPETLRSNLSELLESLVENGLIATQPADVGTHSTV